LRLLKKNSEPHTGTRPSVRLCVGPELSRCVHLNTQLHNNKKDLPYQSGCNRWVWFRFVGQRKCKSLY
jgi:hypothetical protein